MSAPSYRQQMFSHCLRFVKANNPAYAKYAASWYESNQPQELANLRKRVDEEIERHASASASPSRP